MTVSEIQLTVTPAEVVAFFDNLETELEAFNAQVAAAIAIPGQTLAEGIQVAIDLNEQLFTTLEGLTTNPTLLGVLEALDLSSNYALVSLQTAVEEANLTLELSTEDLANLLTSSVTGSLSNVLSTFVGVLNDPFSVANYAAVLSTGLVGTGQLLATNGLLGIQTAGNAGFDYAFEGLTLVEDLIWNKIDTVYDLTDVLAAATGSAVIESINEVIQSVTLAPIQAMVDLGFGITEDVLAGHYAAFNEVLFGAETLVAVVGGSLQYAINAIGAAPLNPEAYLQAGGALLAGGFTSFNTTVGTIGNVAQIPYDVGASVAEGTAGVYTDLNLQFAGAISSVLTALGATPEVADLPLDLAAQINAIIDDNAAAAVAGMEIAAGLIQDTTDFIIQVSNDIEDAIFGLVPTPPMAVAPEAPVAALAASAPSGEPTEAAAAVTDEEDATDEGTTEDATEEATDEATEDVVEDVVEEEAPAEDVVEEDATDEDEDAADDEAAVEEVSDEDDSDDSGSYSSDNDDRKSAKEAKKPTSSADDSADDSDSDSDSDSDGGSDSDSGSDSE